MERRARSDKALEIRQRWWKAAPLFTENAHQVASLLSDRNQPQEAAKYLEEVMYVDPFQSETHLRLGDLYLQSSEMEKAVREFTVFLSLSPVDAAGAHYKLAQALFQSGDRTARPPARAVILGDCTGLPGGTKLLLQLVRR